MVTNKIVAENIRSGHPRGLICTTDFYYAKVGNMLLKAAESSGVRLSNNELYRAVLRITLYFEDIICDSGVWHGFVNKHQALYNKPLPFYTISEDYYYDEPHEEDIRLLIWLTLVEVNPTEYPHPEKEEIMVLARNFYQVLDNEFEQAPINEDLKRFFQEAKFMNDYITVRDVMLWTMIGCYLNDHKDYDDIIDDELDHVSQRTQLEEDDPRTMYSAMTQLMFKYKVGPLALFPKEWLSLMMEANGNDAAAEALRKIEYRDIDVYLLDKSDDTYIYLRSTDDNVIAVRKDGYADLENKDLKEGMGCVAAFVRFNGEWNPNGMDSWGRLGQHFNEVKEHRKLYRDGFSEKHFKSLMKKTGGSPLVYLGNGDATRRFLMDDIGIPEHLMQESRLFEEKNIVAWVPNCNEGPFFSYGLTSTICDERNPFYVKDEKGDDSLELIANPELSQDDMAQYLIENHMVPDAAFDDRHGKERGRQLAQENLDFIARCYRRRYY